MYQVGGLNMQKKHELLWPMTESVPTEKNINNKVKLYFQASKSKSVTEAWEATLDEKTDLPL